MHAVNTALDTGLYRFLKYITLLKILSNWKYNKQVQNTTKF